VSLFTDFAALFAMGAAPAGVALFLIRGQLAGPPSKFWAATGAALAVLGVLIFLSIWWATMSVEADILECRSAPPGTRVECEDAGLLIAVVAIAGAFAVIIYLAGALGLRFWLRGRARRRA